MYCSTCGNKVAEHLNYCNGCGARIEKNPLIVSNAASAQLAKPLTIVAMMGLIGFVAVLKMVLDSGGLDMPAKVIVLVAYLATLFMICAMMVGHMWKNSGEIRIKHHELKASDDYVSPASFRSVTTAQLEPARESGIGSVTEHTTRTLEEMAIPRS